MVKVGVPQALFYYQYYPAFRAFFEELGAETVVSTQTTNETQTLGASRVVADTCLPVKVFLGHVLSLAGECDYIFIPVIRSIKPKVYNCSKFLGLPDMTRAVIPESPPILEIEIDMNRGKGELYRAIYWLVHKFNLNPFRIRQAAKAALKAHSGYLKLMQYNGLTPPEAIAGIPGVQDIKPATATRIQPETGPVIALIGHPYLLYDEYINHRIIHNLEKMGARVRTPEMLSHGELEIAITRLVGKAYWTYESEVVGAGGHYLESGVDGVIGLMAFGCGPDSVMMDMVAGRSSRLKSAPFMCLTLEEHQSPAGILTRLEAFLDMVQLRKQKRAEVCV